MQDIHRAIVCGCGSDRFVPLKQFNTSCCELASDVEDSPIVIQCAGCGSRFQQTPDWNWLSLPPKGAVNA